MLMKFKCSPVTLFSTFQRQLKKPINAGEQRNGGEFVGNKNSYNSSPDTRTKRFTAPGTNFGLNKPASSFSGSEAPHRTFSKDSKSHTHTQSYGRTRTGTPYHQNDGPKLYNNSRSTYNVRQNDPNRQNFKSRTNASPSAAPRNTYNSYKKSEGLRKEQQPYKNSNPAFKASKNGIKHTRPNEAGEKIADNNVSLEPPHKSYNMKFERNGNGSGNNFIAARKDKGTPFNKNIHFRNNDKKRDVSFLKTADTKDRNQPDTKIEATTKDQLIHDQPRKEPYFKNSDQSRAPATERSSYQTLENSKKRLQYSNSSSSGAHRSFKEMIQWRKSRESSERIERNKKLTTGLQTKVGSQYQLANLQSFSCPAVKESDEAQTWTQLGLSDELSRGLIEGLNLKSPLPTQITGIPILLTPKPSSILFASQTGSGKTLTYLLPLIHHLKVQEAQDDTIKNGPKNSPRAVILVPTHELIRQVHRQAKLLSHFTKLKIETGDTIKADDFVDIIISTPRSLLRAVNESRLIKLNLAERIVIDEADTLFATGFHQEIKDLLGLFPNRKSLIATSATIPQQLQRALKTNFPDLQIHVTQGLHAPVSTVRQRFITINDPGNAKSKQCLQILIENPTSRFLVFCNKLAKAESLHKFISDALLSQHQHQQQEADKENSFVLPSMFHGNLPPVQRASIMNNFASGAIKVLICTDLAARGLDTPWVNHVINFDFPRSIQDYLHRIGRTARAGRGGVATSFVTGKDRALYEYIQLGVRQNRVLSQPLPLK